MTWVIRSKEWPIHSVLENGTEFWFTITRKPTEYLTEKEALEAVKRARKQTEFEHNLYVEEWKN